MQRQNYNGGIADFTDVIKSNPNDTVAYFERANAHAAIKHYEGAVADYTQIIKLKPNRCRASSQLLTLPPGHPSASID